MLETRFLFMNEFTDFLSVMKSYPYERISFPKGSFLKKSDESFTTNYYIEEGLIKVSVLHDSGHERTIGFWGNGSIFPIITSMQNFTLEYSILMRAVSEVSAIAFSLNSTRAFMRDYPEISYTMIDHYAKYTNLFLYNATTTAFESLKMRVCNILMIHCLNFNTKAISISQTDIASLIGASRQSVVKILKELREEKVIDTRNRQIIILNIELLSSLCTTLLS